MMSANQRRVEKMAHAAALEAALNEAASWEETDTRTRSKEARAQERLAHADRKLQAKMERRSMEERETEEMNRLCEAKSSKRVTQADIARRQALACMGGPRPKVAKASVSQLKQRQHFCGSVIEASGLDDILMAFQVANQL